MDIIDELKLILREDDYPFFSDETLRYYLSKNGNDLKATAYQCLIVKSEDSSLSIPGVSLKDTSAYFRRLASKYRPNNSGILRGF